jgi:restriction system protein
MNEQSIWGIHAGRLGEAHVLFIQKKLIALGWHEVGDLSKLPKDREAFKNALAAAYPNTKPGAVPTTAGMLYRFIHEVQEGDFVAYPSKNDHQINLGRITGPYKFQASDDAHYSHQRQVEWLRVVPRTSFTQGALYEIGSALSFFLIKSYAAEFRTAIEGKSTLVPAKGDPSVAIVADEIEDNTADFVLKALSQELKGHEFSHFVAHLLNRMGYRTRVSLPGADGGIDIVAHKDELGFEPPIIKVQVKSIDGSSGDPEVSALYGKIGDEEFGLFVTLGTFTKQAVAFAKSKSNLRLIDGHDLVALVLNHYESFDSRYKGIIPLKRVYVPAPADDEQS